MKELKLKMHAGKFKNIKKTGVLISFLILCAGCFGIFLFKVNKENTFKREEVSPQTEVKSSLVIPSQDVLLNRLELINHIQEKLNKQEGIQTVSLVGVVGMGGVGKTTLARLFARTQNISIIYEINAETKNSLLLSFKDLAKNLTQNGTQERKEEFDSIQNIKDPQEQEKQILSFVQKRLKERKNWLLIYDNVESFSDIKEYFPQDPKLWGHGQVIITTRNNYFKNSAYIEPENIIQVNELTKEEAFTLFTKILFEGEKLDAEKSKEISNFLESIPPFPLDIVVAASYIKSTKIPFMWYLENLKEHNDDFEILQQNLLKESSPYTKTRSYIITQSLNKIIEIQPDFVELLLLLSLVDSQKIPRGLLEQYKNKETVDTFIHNLKKYSLIWSENSSTQHNIPEITLHRSTQTISLRYLFKKLGAEKINQLMQSITEGLDSYIDKMIEIEDVIALQAMIKHLEKVLSYNKLLNDDIRYTLKSKLGNIYYYSQTGSYVKAKKTLEKNIKYSKKNDHLFNKNILNDLIYLGRIYVQLDERAQLKSLVDYTTSRYGQNLDERTSQAAWALSFLGDMYNVLGDYQKAKKGLERSCELYKKHFSNDQMGLARSLAYLGNVYLKLGNYKESKEYLEESSTIYAKLFPDMHYRKGWILQILGRAHLSLRNCKEAISTIEEGLKIYKGYFSDDKILVAWASAYLGEAYIECGMYEKAVKLLEERINISKKHYHSEHNIFALELLFLGRARMKMNNLEGAENLLKESLRIFKHIFGEDHLDTAFVINSLGELYYLKGDLEPAEEFLKEALSIFQRDRKPESYKPLEILSDIYLKKSLQAQKDGREEEALTFRQQSIEYLERIIELFYEYFPTDVQYIDKMKSKKEVLIPKSKIEQ